MPAINPEMGARQFRSQALALTARIARRAANVTLRTKGVLALTLLILYLSLMSWVIADAKQQLYVNVQQIESNYAKQAIIDQSFKVLAHTLVATQALLGPSPALQHDAAGNEGLSAHIGPMRKILDEARQMYPLLARDIADLEQAMSSARAQPGPRHLSEARDSQQKLMAKLQDILTALQARNLELAQDYSDRLRNIGVVAISANIAGIVVSIAVILLFFTRLANDIKRLQERAVAIVAGYSGAPLVNDRRDEVGGLIEAVNRMQVDLRHWERQQEVSRQQRFYQEKMAAVGSLAAAIGHEVSNPIAAISGIAQSIMGETKDDTRGISKVLHDSAAQILTQTKRITIILRQMADLTRPHSPDPELLDLNELIRSTCSFISHDQRFGGIEIEMALDQGIPAAMAVGDHITQILMNLLINAADALDQLPDRGRARIRILTRLEGSTIHLAIADTGQGMSPEVLEKAFQEFFTTKPPGKGRGIGLFLCKTLIEQGGGRIELASAQGVGTTANLYLPVPAEKSTNG